MEGMIRRRARTVWVDLEIRPVATSTARPSSRKRNLLEVGTRNRMMKKQMTMRTKKDLMNTSSRRL